MVGNGERLADFGEFGVSLGLASKPSPRTEAILVPTDSSIQTAADLAGKKVAVTKGSSANALLVRALQSAGLKWGDAEAVFLQPADAKAAFEGGSVDAWSIWDPYYALEEHDTGARTLLTEVSIGAANRSFYLASRRFARHSSRDSPWRASRRSTARAWRSPTSRRNLGRRGARRRPYAPGRTAFR